MGDSHPIVIYYNLNELILSTYSNLTILQTLMLLCQYPNAHHENTHHLMTIYMDVVTNLLHAHNLILNLIIQQIILGNLISYHFLIYNKFYLIPLINLYPFNAVIIFLIFYSLFIYFFKYIYLFQNYINTLHIIIYIYIYSFL